MSPLWNSVLPTKVYVIVDVDYKVLGEEAADSAHHAYQLGRPKHPTARGAILKEQYIKTKDKK
jgi:hypothetical protein